MKNLLSALFLTLSIITLSPSLGAAPVGDVQGLKYDAATRMLFGENRDFASDMEITTSGADGNMSIKCRMSASDLRCRFEFSVSDIKGGDMPPEAAEQMKAMGMDRTVVISTDGGKNVLLVYPGLKSYVTMPVPQGVEEEGSEEDLKTSSVEVGSETIEGHKCVKNKITVTDKQGAKHESLVWNAKDLHNFPIMVQTVEEGTTITMRFKNLTLSKPQDALFLPPAGYTQYSSMQAMMQQEMMKRMAQMTSGEE